MKFRIKELSNGYFAQVKLNTFSFWKTLSYDSAELKLYPNKDIRYPVKKDEALERIKKYKLKIQKEKEKPTYTYLD